MYGGGNSKVLAMLAPYKGVCLRFDKLAVLAVATGAFLAGSSAHAVTATFDLTTPNVTNFTSTSFTDNGISLTVSDAVGTNIPASDALTTNSFGLCSYAEVGTSAGRCTVHFWWRQGTQNSRR
jgi:hypothetical protein